MKQNWEKQESFFQSSLAKYKLYQAFYFKRPSTPSQANKSQKKPETESPKNVLMIVHGLGEHFGRYSHFPDFLSDSVDLICGFDHLGHGRSEGIRGHIDSFDRYVEDLKLALLHCQKNCSAIFSGSSSFRIHLLGHSMGGLISLLFLAQNTSIPLASASLSSPLLGIRVEVPRVKKILGQILARFWASLKMKSGLKTQLLSHDTEVVRAYENDPLVHSYVTPLFFQALQDSLKQINSSSPQFSIPIQFLVSMQDQIVDPEAAVKFYDQIHAPKKRLQKYREFYHEGFNEVGKEKIFQDLRDWIH